MVFRHATAQEPAPAPDVLTARMVGIGMLFAATPQVDADIECTLVHASAAGMIAGELRVLAVLTSWLGVHHTHVNADRLVRLVLAHPVENIRAYWSAVATWLVKDRRFARLIKAYVGRPVELLPTGTEFQIKRRGEDVRFVGSKLRVPTGILRDRAQDVLAPAVLIQRHAGYRNRVLMGPSFRADVWTAIEHEPKQSIAALARKASCSFATAWQTVQDYRLLHPGR